MKNIYIFGGGTIKKIRPHLSLSANAYGTTAIKLWDLCMQNKILKENYGSKNTFLWLTKMCKDHAYAFEWKPETYEDLEKIIESLIKDKNTKIIFMSCAIVDFDLNIITQNKQDRLKSDQDYLCKLKPLPKLISKIRKERKDIFLVGFKTTHGKDKVEMFEAGLRLCKTSSCNLVFVNDIKNRRNMIVTPEEGLYDFDTRDKALEELVNMTASRSNLSFSSTTVISGATVPLKELPENFYDVVRWCIKNGYYKPNIMGVTTGHYCYRPRKGCIISSIRKKDYTKNTDMVAVRFYDRSIFACADKPSVGITTQRMLLDENPEYDSIIHFHSPMKKGKNIPVRSQKEFECGSFECGKNTLAGLKKFGSVKAVMLDKHGPNILFNSKDPAEKTIEFIKNNFKKCTGIN